MVQLIGQLGAIIQLRTSVPAGASQPQEREARRITGIPALPVIELCSARVLMCHRRDHQVMVDLTEQAKKLAPAA